MAVKAEYSDANILQMLVRRQLPGVGIFVKLRYILTYSVGQEEKVGNSRFPSNSWCIVY